MRQITSESIRDVADMIRLAKSHDGKPVDLWNMIFKDEEAQDMVTVLVSEALDKLCLKHEDCRINQILALTTVLLAIGYFAEERQSWPIS